MSKKTVVIAGYHNLLGEPILRAFCEASNNRWFNTEWEIRVFTSHDPRTIPGHCRGRPVNRFYVCYDDSEALDELLAGADVVINTLENEHSQYHWDALGSAAARARVGLYIPPEFGPDHETHANISHPIFQDKREHAAMVRSTGLKTVQVFCGLLHETSLPNNPRLGIQLTAKRLEPVIPYNRPEARVTFTSTYDVGRSLAVLASRYLPRQLPDKLRLSGSSTTFTQLAEQYMQITGQQVSIHPCYIDTFDPGNDISRHLRCAAGLGYLDFSQTSLNEWVNPQAAPLWKWMSVRRRLSVN